MNYQQLRDYALQCSLEHHLCNIEGLTEAGKTPDDILEMVEAGDEALIIYEAYEYYEPSSLANSIEDLRGANLYNFTSVLRQVNGEEWFSNFKEGK